MPKRLPFKEFVKIYDEVPRLCIDLVIVKADGILMTLRDIDPWKGLWHIPGGTILLHEKIGDAIDRIAQSELGVKVKVKKILGAVEFLEDMGKGYKHAVSIAYLVEPLSNNFKNDNQSKEIKFFKEIPENTVKEHTKFITQHWKGIFN